MLLGSSTAGCCTAAGTTVEKQITNLLESIYFIFSTHGQVEIGYYHNCETQEPVDSRNTSAVLMCCKGKANQARKNLANTTDETKPLVKSVCTTALKSLFWASHLLCTRARLFKLG